MKLTESMVRDLVATSLTANEIGDLLTMTGFEIESIEMVEGEPVLDINIMANRGDGASSLGIAREILAKDGNARPTELFTRLSAGLPSGDTGATDAAKMTSVTIETDACPIYSCRVFPGITNGPAPGWIQERLRKVGQRPISLLVDLTNYVLLETGQPLHAFDFDKLAGRRIVVREAQQGEKFVTLDGIERELDARTMMICDADRAVAVAGVMGGAETEVSASTTSCLLESAHFRPKSVRRTRKALGLHTEASYRFERWVDPAGVERALNRFAELLKEAGGPDPVPGAVSASRGSAAETPNIAIRTSRAAHLLGLTIETGEVRRILTSLGFNVSPGEAPDESLAIPPTWRNDIAREEDLIEEVGRVHGYERIPELRPQGTTPQGGLSGRERLIRELRQTMLRCGFHQAISHSLRDVHPLDAPGDAVRVRNPHAPDMAVLRSSLWPCLAEAAARNGGRDLHLFEIGRVFSAEREWRSLAAISIGNLDAAFWRRPEPASADFFSMKGTILRVLHRWQGVGVSELATPDPRLHMTRSACVDIGGTPVGVIGQIHPDVAHECGLPATAVLAELDLEALPLAEHDVSLRAISRNPSVRRDLSFVIEKSVPYSRVVGAIESACGDVLERCWLFDIFEGTGIPEGSHSFAIALQFRKQGENFTDEEANQVRDRAVQALEQLGARLR